MWYGKVGMWGEELMLSDEGMTMCRKGICCLGLR